MAKRITVAPGVYRDAYGYSVRVKIRGISYEERYPLGTPIDDLRQARRDLKRAHEDDPKATRTGTLEADIAAYVATLATRARRRDEAALLQHWIDAGFGMRHRHSITPQEIQQQLARWATAPRIRRGRTLPPFRPATIRHLRRVLGTVYRSREGKSGTNPVRDVAAIRVRYEEARGLPFAIIQRIIDEMPDRGRPTKDGERPTINLTKLRLAVMAYTGLPQAQLKRIEARDIHWRQRCVLIRPRRKGAGVPARTLPLTREGIAAFRALVRARGLGPFSTRSMGYAWRRAIDRTRAAWEAEQRRRGALAQPWPAPDDARAYDLRHSFGTRVYGATGDLRATSELLLHATMETTKRYTIGAVSERTRRAIAQVSGTLRTPAIETSGEREMKARRSRPTKAS